jgi:acylphosphatase
MTAVILNPTEQAMTEEPVREEVRFSGRVQGVGFRYTVNETARRFAVTGFVENLPDGRVRLVVESTAGEIDRFVAAVEAEMRRYITGVDRRREPAVGEFADFGIRR